MRTVMSRIAFLLALSQVLVAQLGILAPQNGVTFSGNPLVIVVQSEEADLDPAPAILSKSEMDEYIHFKVNLQEGFNRFIIRYLNDQGQVVVETLRVIYHPSKNNRWGALYSSFHQTSIPREVCSDCHDFDMDSPSTCLECHNAVVDTLKADLHPPFEDGCFDCHEDYQVTTEVCFDCHDFESAERQHAPFAVGDCTVCHNPHGSPNPVLLRGKTIMEQCGYCHDLARYQEGTHPVIRHPMQSKDLTCTTCHNPHGSPYLRFLVSNPQNFCTTCHESK